MNVDDEAVPIFIESDEQGESFEPPKVTPVGNLNDLLQQVCVHEDDE